jgi:hypothetical protein
MGKEVGERSDFGTDFHSRSVIPKTTFRETDRQTDRQTDRKILQKQRQNKISDRDRDKTKNDRVHLIRNTECPSLAQRS